MDTLSEKITALPTWQAALVGITGSLMVVTSLYLLRNGQVAPIATVAVVGIVLYITFLRFKKAVVSRPPPSQETQFSVFRSMEPADQTRVNPWTGFLQEDVYANRTGPIGTFVGNDDYAKNAPLYPIDKEADYGSDISARNCPTDGQCTCLPMPGDPTKTHCGYMLNGTFVPCPSDCCSPSCTY